MKEKSNASALHAGADTAAHRPSDVRLCSQMRSSLLPATVVSAPTCADSRYWRGDTTRGRCADIWRRAEAKHCSSLCSQSEGDKYWVAKHGMKIQQGYVPGTLVMFATCSCPSLCKQSELQCWRRNRRLCEHKSPLQGSCLQPRCSKSRKREFGIRIA